MRTNRVDINTGILIAAMTLSACTNSSPVAPYYGALSTSGSPLTPITSPSTLGGTAPDLTYPQPTKNSGFTYSKETYTRVIQKRKSYTYSSNDTPLDRDEQEFKKEIKLVYKVLKDFLNRTSVLVERYAHSPYINKSDRVKILKDSNDPEKTGPVVVSILKDVYGPQSPNIDLTKIETSLCQLSGSEWNTFFEELKSALKEHKKSIKSAKHKSKGKDKKELKEDKHFINDLLDHEIWRLVIEASEEKSVEHDALVYLKTQHCGGSTSVPTIQPEPAKTQSENKSDEQDSRSDENYYKNLDQQKDKDGAEQPLGVRYYSPEQLENLPQPDPQAPNVFTLDPEQQKLMLGT
ncbi:MAG: hypothetical protein KA715_12470 [Xanthomonadaceae bacterium]|nr:hypothetical protein [Xanthomonadaceae bacterium]